MSQRLDTTHAPSKLHLEIGAERGARYPCPECSTACKAHDFKEYTWRHLIFFSIIAISRLDYQRSIALNTESDEWTPHEPEKPAVLHAFRVGDHEPRPRDAGQRCGPAR